MSAPRSTASGGPHAGQTPTVILADDHPPILAAVRGALEPAFHVVAAVADGERAVDASLRLDPDLVVLDVAMPGMDGFQAALELKRQRSRARIVFLTMHDVEDLVVAAVESGVLGYVLKSRIASDLRSALQHALDERLFVPSLQTLMAAAGRGREHAVHLSANGADRGAQLGSVLATALRRGDPVAVIATESTRAGIERRLTGLGLDVARATAEHRYMAFDAGDTMSRIMPNGTPDRERLAGLADVLERAHVAAARPQSRTVVVGEMVDLLCRSGRTDAAISLEKLWNDLTPRHPFLTMCMYSLDCFTGQADSDRLQRVCAEHSAVVHG